jgi:hypothetical protein
MTSVNLIPDLGRHLPHQAPAAGTCGEKPISAGGKCCRCAAQFAK